MTASGCLTNQVSSFKWWQKCNPLET